MVRQVCQAKSTFCDNTAQDSAFQGMENSDDLSLLVKGHESDKRSTICSECVTLLRIGIPLMLVMSLSFTMQMVDLAMVGHLGVHELGAAALGNTMYNTTYFFILGVANGLDTFLAQAWGAQDESAMMVWLQRGAVSLFWLTLLNSVLLLFVEPILLHGLQQSPELSSMAGAFCVALIPKLWCEVACLLLQKWLQAKGVIAPMVWIRVAGNVFNVLANLVLISQFGFIGAPLATSACWVFQLFVTIAYLQRTEHWPGWNRFVSGIRFNWRSIKAYMTLGLPSGAMLCMEAWSFDLGILVVATFLTTIEMDAHILMLNMAAFTFLTFPLGISIAASIRIGHLLGAGNPELAKVTAGLAVAAGSGFMLCAGLAIAASQGRAGLIFTSDDRVLVVIRENVWLLAAMQVVDGLQGCAAGALRGLGRHTVVFWLNFIFLMGVGFVSGTLLVMYTDLGIGGTWIGLCIGLSSLSVALVVTLCMSDWDAAAIEAKVRTEDAAAETTGLAGTLDTEGDVGVVGIELDSMSQLAVEERLELTVEAGSPKWSKVETEDAHGDM